MTTDACPGPEELLSFLHGEGSPELAPHLDACAACRARAEALRTLEKTVRAASPERHSATCPPPATFRDLLAGRLGADARQNLEAHAARCRRCLDVLAAAHDETVLERMTLSPALRARLEEMAPVGLPEAPTRPAVRPRTRRVRLHRLLGKDGPAWVPFAAAAALFLAFVGLVVVSTSSPSRPAPKTDTARVQLPEEPEVDPAVVDRMIAEREEKIRRQKEEREQLERERLERQAQLEAIVASRQKQEEALRQALDSRKEEEQKKAREEIRRIDEQKQKVTVELEKAKENERRVEASVAAQVIAHLERVHGQVFLVEGTARTPAKAGVPVAPGQGIETVGFDSRCTVRYLDKTRVELAADVKVREFTERHAEGGGKRVHLLQGALTADVKKQPAGRPMIFGTPQGEATVLGTTLRIVVDALSTRLEVTEGRVRLTRADGKSVEVPGDHFAVAAIGIELVARKPMLSEDFQDPRAVDARWKLLLVGKDVAPALVDGKVQFSLLKTGTKENVQGEIHSRLAYPAPMKVSMDVELSHQHPDLLAGFTFVPAESEPKSDNKDAVLCTVAGTRRGLSFGTGGGKGGWGWRGLQNAGVNAPTPRREHWTLELQGDEVRVFIDGKQTFLQKHGGKVHTHYHLRLEGTGFASPNLPAGAFVRYDNVRAEPLTR